jgi:two-component system NtrC family response regulator
MQDAIKAVDTQPIDAVIAELMLQQGSGLDLIQYVRQKFPNKTIPIIAMGSDSSGYREGQAYQRGADIFVAKPIAVDVLTDALSKLVTMIPS